MERTLVRELSSLRGETVRVCGWAEELRSQGQTQFLVIRDHTGRVQAVHEKAANPEMAALIGSLPTESAIEITGKVVLNPAIKFGGLEVAVASIAVVSRADLPLPLCANAPLETRLDWRFLDLRIPRNLFVFKLQTALEHAMRLFWMSEGFIEIHSPKFMDESAFWDGRISRPARFRGKTSDLGTELFRVEYFDRFAYLAQSPQFFKQMAMAAGFDRVFEIGPVFRANPSVTSRHDSEFTSVDVEISWIESHEDLMRLEERWLQHVFRLARDKFGDEIRATFGTEVVVPEIPFPRVTMEEAYDILDRMGHHIDRGREDEGEKGDLDPEGERLLCQHFREKTGHEFVFVTDYPVKVRPFYHMRHESDPCHTKSFDLLWKGLEVTTGSQREHRYAILVEQAKEKGFLLGSIQYYLDFFRYGCPPHGGYGFGLTRMLMVMLGFADVRETTYLHRGVHRLAP